MGTNEKRRKLLIRQSIILALIIAALVAGSLFFMHWWRVSKLLQVQFVMSDGRTSPLLYLETANTPPLRAQGLMYRRELPENGGMIFLFPDESERSFWMKNTYVPLDMIHVDRELKVVGILENRPVLSEEGKGVGKPAMYVIEVRGGASKQWGLQTGARLEFRSPPPAAR